MLIYFNPRTVFTLLASTVVMPRSVMNGRDVLHGFERIFMSLEVYDLYREAFSECQTIWQNT